MSREDVREHVDRALESAVATNTDLDDVEAEFQNALERVEELRVIRGES
ncbi:hypothetical protein [Halalkalicoccus sp. NIPERK01]|nr:hypothetical protein [Halalkalicoccus sp. NIPERK01]MDL5361317.1 hypothetical protein [Halalkalicoccus sp. NIPERK01]